MLSVLLAAASAGAQTGLRERVENSPALPFQAVTLKAQPPHPGWKLGMVSWIAVDRTGLIYLLQRGDKADAIVVLDRHGHVVRSWGKGMFTMPHSIRIDPQGKVWTTDAASSVVYEFSPTGKKFLGLRQLDLQGATNSKGQARFQGLPDSTDGALYFEAFTTNLRGVAVCGPNSECIARHGIYIGERPAMSEAE